MTFKARLNFPTLASAIATGILITGASAWADDPQTQSSDMGTLDQAGEAQVTEMEEKDVTRNYLSKEMWGLKPTAGYTNYTASDGSRASRAMYGLLTDFNLASAFGFEFTRWYTGLQSGFLFSHQGNPDSNFFGSSSEINVGQGGANFFIIPANAKIGFAPLDWMRVSAHGGVNVLYRTLVEALPLDNTQETWRLIPNVGADVEFGFGPNVALNFRPDWTLAANQSIFTGTVSLGITI